jgi:hypothetical protein
MPDIDRPGDVEPLPQPPWAPRPRADPEPLRYVPRPDRLDGIGGQRCRRRHFGQWLAVWPPEPQRSVDQPIDAVALLVDGAVMTTTE